MKRFFQFGILILLQWGASELSAQSPSIDTVLLQFKSDIPFAGIGLPQKVLQDALGRPFCYVASKEGGLRIYGVADIEHPVLKKVFPIADFSGQEVMNLWQDGHLLYLALGNFFGGANPPGLAIIDLTDPQNAFVTDVWISGAAGRGCAFVTVSGDYAYLGAMSQGLIILRISDSEHIEFVSQYIPDIHFPVQNPNSIQLPNARGMEVRGDEVWLCYDAGGLRIIDISDKSQPDEINRYINPGALGKQQAYNNIVLSGDTAYIAVDFCGLEILDISDADNISEIAWWNPWDCQSPGNTWLNSPGHSNQIELDAEKHLVFLSTGRSELNIVDVSQPGQPRQIGAYGSPDDNYFTWGAGIHEDRVYLSYISSLFPFFSVWAGVRILEWDVVTGTTGTTEPFSDRLYPNPFHESFLLEMDIKQQGLLKIDILDIHGKLVAEWINVEVIAGEQSFRWQGELPPGCYFIRLTTGSGSVVRKVVFGV